MAVKRTMALPYARRSSNASEDDFFDIPDESILALVKRHVRRARTWMTLALLVFVWFVYRRLWKRSYAGSPIRYDLIDWSRYAYSQYASSHAYLCNAVMMFDSLERVGSRAERVLFYPIGWGSGSIEGNDRNDQLLIMARDRYKAALVAVDDDMISGEPGPSQSWNTSIAKLLAFGQIQYERVIHIDSDSVILSNLDELFFLPSAKVAMPRAYYTLPEVHELGSYLIVLEPSYKEYLALLDAAKEITAAAPDDIKSDKRYDMDILNSRYYDSAMVLPHRQYGLVTGEFRALDHRNYLGTDYEAWDPEQVLAEAKFVHFADWPLPKPWIMWPQKLLAHMQPKCKINPGTYQESGCQDREVWRRIYEDFRKRRRVGEEEARVPGLTASMLTIS